MSWLKFLRYLIKIIILYKVFKCVQIKKKIMKQINISSTKGLDGVENAKDQKDTSVIIIIIIIISIITIISSSSSSSSSSYAIIIRSVWTTVVVHCNDLFIQAIPFPIKLVYSCFVYLLSQVNKGQQTVSKQSKPLIFHFTRDAWFIHLFFLIHSLVHLMLFIPFASGGQRSKFC